MWVPAAQKRIEAPITTGVFYGTANLTTETWGYVAEVPRTHEALTQRLNQLLVEAVVDDAGSGAHYEQAWKVLVGDALGGP